MNENKRRQEFLKRMMDTNLNGMSNEKIARLEKTPEQIRRESIKKQRNKQKSDLKKGLLAAGTVSLTIGLTAVGLDTYESYLENKNKTAYENEVETENDNVVVMNETKTSQEEIDRFLKNMYIDLYEQAKGECDYTTENITIEKPNDQNYVLVDSITGEYYAHGDTPAVTHQKLEEDGISYEIEENVRIYSIKDKEGKTIDAIALKEGILHKIIMADQYGEAYNSILVDMGEVFVDGISYANFLENGNERDIAVSKNKFIESLEKQAKENQKITGSKKQEMVAQIKEDDFEIE